MKRLFALIWFCLWATFVLPQTATVTRNVNLRPDPSTDHAPLAKLRPPAPLALVEPHATNGFYHVKAGQQQGWVWGHNIKIQLQQPPPGLPGNGSLIEPSPVSQISSGWDKGTPQNTIFHGNEGQCGESGDGGDTATNLLKNRIDVPAAYHYVIWDAINQVTYPHGANRSRMDWTQSQLNQIAPFEGVPIAVEGYLYKVKVESSSANSTSGGESTNCHAHLASDVDWHMPLTAQSGQGENLAIIVETTPRMRQLHPNWTVNRLKPWTEHVNNQANPAFKGQRVRISGWLMFDPEHQDMITSGLRSTLWEIHPITKIEVFQNGGWADLDSLP